jgi:hypothetical protein
VEGPRKLRPTLSTRAKEARLATLLAGRRPEELGLQDQVRAAQALGSLELSGFTSEFAEVLAVARGGEGPEPVVRLFAALKAVPFDERVSLEAIRLWHAALYPQEAFRKDEPSREPPPAPAAFIGSRLASLTEWLDAEATRELTAHQLGALGMARFLEILPFSDGNGRIARILASHLMVRAGGRPLILVRGDGPLLKASLRAAFRLETEPLASLLEEASGRSLDVMIQCLAGAREP